MVAGFFERSLDDAGRRSERRDTSDGRRLSRRLVGGVSGFDRPPHDQGFVRHSLPTSLFPLSLLRNNSAIAYANLKECP
jgi:hypothetical protein